jgi:DNA-binding winged helix-turn-helix (wHTH) protein
MRFDSWELDQGRRTLFDDGVPVHLSPKAFQLLQVLMTRAPNAVSKEELHELIWPETYVADTNLAGIVAEVRAALRDDARSPRYLRTVHGFGYAFAAPVHAAPKARYRVTLRGVEIPLSPGENLIGRKAEAAVFIDDVSVSREHARITVGEGATLEDLGSKNGTFVNGDRITAPQALRNRDLIGAGSVTFTFHDTATAESTVTIHSAG